MARAILNEHVRGDEMTVHAVPSGFMQRCAVFAVLAIAACAMHGALLMTDAVIVVPATTPAPVQLAVRDLAADAHRATGRALTIVTAVPPTATAVIIPGVVGQTAVLDDLARRGVIDCAPLRGTWEAYALVPVTNPFPGVANGLIVAGSDVRGVVFGLYETSERLYGTDPQYLWTDHRPAPVAAAAWDGPAVWEPSPAFRYRALYFNDEDQLAGWKGASPQNALDDVTCDRLFQTILRMRGNALAPPVHAAPFTRAQQQRARERGILVAGTTGFEALRGAPGLVWPVYVQEKFGTNLPYSFILHPREVEAFWTDIVRANRDFISIWPVGMRGTRDWPFWMDDPAAPASMEGRAAVVSKVIQRQRQILDRELGPDPARAFIFTMRNEGLDLYRTGNLDLPDNTILVWDDWPGTGRVRDLPSAREAANPGGNGIYYHLTASQGQWVQYLPPALVAAELTRAYRAGANRYVRFNVGDLREFLFTTAVAMDVARRTPAWMATPDAPRQFTQQWCARQFGAAAAGEAVCLYDRLNELENRGRSTSIVEAVAPWVTTRMLYDLWDPRSIHRLVRETGAPEFLGVYGRLLNLQRLPRRMWPVSRAFLQALKPGWDDLYQRACTLRERVPAEHRQFFTDNLVLQIETARQINAWALAIFAAFEHAGQGAYPAAAQDFTRAAAAMDAIAAARASACHGAWENWYRGETLGLFEQSLWTLKPQWHAADARAGAALARQCAGTTALQVFPILPDALDVSRMVCPLFAPMVTLPATYRHDVTTRVWVCGVMLDCPAAAQPMLRVGAATAALPATGEGRRRIFCVPVPPAAFGPGENAITFTVNGPREDKALGYGVANLFLAVEHRASPLAVAPRNSVTND